MSEARTLESEAGTQQDNVPQQGDVEARARRMGWSPLEEFRGDPSRWVAADEFLRRGDEELPIMRERMRRQDRMLEDSQRKLDDMAKMMQDMRSASQRNEERAYQRALAKLVADRDAAVAAGDQAAFRAADKEMRELEADRQPAAQPANRNERQPDQPQPPAPEIVDWVGRQPWWNKHHDATAAAVAIQGQIARANPNLPILDQLAEVERRVRGAYPEAFPAQRRDTPAPVSGSAATSSVRKPGKMTIDQLPAEERGEARKAFNKMKKAMPDFTEDEYMANYDWNG